jgi:signal transduction histidine kinase
MKQRLFHKYPLLNKMILLIFLFALIVATLSSIAHYNVANRVLIRESQDALERIRHGQLTTLVNSIWNFNQEAIDIQLQSIVSLPYVSGLKMQLADGKVTRLGNEPTDENSRVNQIFPLIYNEIEPARHLGTISFFIDTKHIHERVLRGISWSLLVQVAGLFITCLFILFLFLTLFNRHLNKIVNYTKSLKIESIGRPLQLKRNRHRYDPRVKVPDELDRIVTALNDMGKRIQEGIHSQQAAEKVVRLEKKFSDTLINSIPGLFFVLNEDLQLVRFNKQFAMRIGGSSKKDIRQLDILSRIDPNSQKKVIETIRKLFHDHVPVEMEALLLDSADNKIPYVLIGSLLEEEGRKYLIGLGLDISDKKLLEDELRQAQKMEAIGTLAGGIAHDFNNILTVIFGNAGLAQMKTDKQDSTGKYINEILKAASRAKELVAQILTFSRKQEQEKKALQLSLLVKEVLKLLRSSIPTTIEIKQDLSSNALILADTTQMHQVLMNLCTNAYHAMQEEGGVLTAKLSEVEISLEEPVRSLDIPAGKYLCLEISDTGCGMDKITQEKIFEPYFTTKEVGSGTGLGLAVVHGIVQKHGGRIAVDSEPGQGTTFRVYFPCTHRSPEIVDEHSFNFKNIPAGNERILVVDDEQEILEVLAELLSENGYKVSTFQDSEKALDFFRANPDDIDLVITDMAMPKLTGYEMGQKMLASRKQLPIILCTGFSESIHKEKVIRAGFQEFLEKPVDFVELSEKIRDGLG